VRLDSGAFLVAFAAFFLVYSAAPSRVKRWLLVAGSLAFYATLSLRYVPLLLSLGVFTFWIGARIDRASGARRDQLLWLGVGVNVLALAFFKWRPHEIAAPLGVSFYTLQAVSYVVDIHRRVYAPPRSIISFLASFTLFPHLLSGPIVRSSSLVPQVERVDAATWSVSRRALFLFAMGLLKKFVADRLAPTADAAFDATHPISPFEAWTGLVAYAGQLYGDFSGYTDMATALALLLGLELPPNFDLPYLATSPADFWRRWHISLSTWLRDYVYLPLGVRFRRHRHLTIIATWIFAGLWHGVGWLFLLYGLYHGVLLAITHWLSRRFESNDPNADGEPHGVRRVAQTALTFYLVLIGYVLFRARSVKAAADFIVSLHVPRAGAATEVSHGAVMSAVACVLALVFCHALDYVVQRRRRAIEGAWVLWPTMVVAAVCIALFSGAAQPFIYFAF
jgi:D-alanyl-lipoteichoic acid acyltransferase DltB (MBOAT superfamily)